MIRALKIEDLEMFIHPNLQRKGYGNQLLTRMQEYTEQHNLAGITLLTNRFSFAPEFYKKNGYSDGEHILFMYKSI